ncbi:MAG TPA: endonuclease V, partial [Planctomycetaceae bacterium]|nr:endonuclease V [Planctomycetaceae bacterium]
LTFRELPVLLDVMARVAAQGRLAPLVLVDGTGILHPRRAGIAANFGVVTGIPTIGVSKKLLCGQFELEGLTPESPRPVTYKGEMLGTAVKATERSRPVFVSPGNRITVEDAARIARLLFHGHRLPEPIYWADRLSREAARDRGSTC